MVADHTPEQAAVQKLAAGHAATQDGLLIHRVPWVSSFSIASGSSSVCCASASEDIDSSES